MRNEMIPAPKKLKYDGNIKAWVDEAIWGHRFYNDQTPWLVFLEFLCLFRSRNDDGCALDEQRKDGSHEDISYRIPRLSSLRGIVFNNPHIQHIETTKISNSEQWSEWMSKFHIEGHNFSFLQERFPKFSSLSHVVKFFQDTAVEPHRQRRWTSRFIFPYGPDCLYADLPGTLHSPDRRFFARGGELLYLMLCRGGSGPRIAKLINDNLLLDKDPWNRIARSLLPDNNRLHHETIPATVGYLPYKEREEYTAIARTYLDLLNLSLSGAVLIDPLVRLSSLHMLLYMLRRASEEIGDNSEPKFVLEIAAPKKTRLFDLSSESFSANQMAPLRAVRAHIENVRNEQGWRDALQARVQGVAIRKFLYERFAWEQQNNHISDPDQIISELWSDVEKRHKQHVAKVHREWTRQIGLTVSQRGVGTWYAPTDSLLKALVMCTVQDGREEYHRFLKKLYDRFRIVIAAPEAEEAFGNLPTDQHAFTQNAQRLEQRLRTLGLLRRLSDDCAYVQNPFRRRE